MARVRKFPIIGGPLDGQYANRKDFFHAYTSPMDPKFSRPEGPFADHRQEYIPYNAGDNGSPSSMIWLWRPMVSASIRAMQ